MAIQSLKSQSSGRIDMLKFDPANLHEEPGWNERIDNDDLTQHIRQLADSIKEVGVLEPLTVYLSDEGKAVVTNGHCRLLAVKIAIAEGADIKTVPVRTEPKASNDADRVLSMITRNSGKPLTPIETSRVIKRLDSFGWTAADISLKTGYTKGHISNFMALSSAPARIQRLVEDGKVSATLAVDTMRGNSEDRATEILESAVVSAVQSGKKKATRKHTYGPIKKLTWANIGPDLFDALEILCNSEDIETDIAAAKDVLERAKTLR
jgi:ParB-like chromosome segregation protein Spo0J